MRQVILVAAITGIALVAPTPARAALTDNLVGYWQFDDGVSNPTMQNVTEPSSIGSVQDDGFRGNAATVESGDAMWDLGKLGGGLAFDGASQYGTVASSTDLISMTGALSISAWVKPAGVGALQNILAKRNGSNASAFAWEYNGAATNHWFRIGGSWRNVNMDYDPAEWQHVVVTWESGQPIKGYHNGGGVGNTPTVASAAYSGTIPHDATKLNLGRNSPSGPRYFRGSIDEVAIWNRALTDAEVGQLYNSGAGMNITGSSPSITYTNAAEDSRFDPNDFASLGTINLSAGTVTFNTTSATVSGAFSGTGAWGKTEAGTEVAVFTFDDVDLLSGVAVNVIGTRPAVLLSKSDITLGTTVDLDGTNGNTGTGMAVSEAGGFAGGATKVQTLDAVSGPGRGQVLFYGYAAGGGGGHGGSGGNGELYNNNANNGGIGGLTYNDGGVSDLPGGSGGAGSHWLAAQYSSGGGGGGAIALGALGDIDILATGLITADGGLGGDGNTGGGGGSGGTIRIDAGGIFNNAGSITAVGGNGMGGAVDGGGGGGGRVAIYALSFTQGNIDVSGGAANGPSASGGDAGTVVTTVIPEPSTLVLTVLGLLGLLARGRRKKR